MVGQIVLLNYCHCKMLRLCIVTGDGIGMWRLVERSLCSLLRLSEVVYKSCIMQCEKQDGSISSTIFFFSGKYYQGMKEVIKCVSAVVLERAGAMEWIHLKTFNLVILNY